jgi:hypothetical protein
MGKKNQSVKDSKNVNQIQIDTSGSDSKTTINIDSSSKSDGIDIGVDWVYNILLMLGRQILEYLGVKKFYFTIILSLFCSGYLLLRTFLHIFVGEFLLYNNEHLITFFGAVWFVLTLLIFVLYFTTTCKNCGNKFALREINRKHLGSVKYRGYEHHKIKKVTKCDFCGNVIGAEFIDKEPLKEKELVINN